MNTTTNAINFLNPEDQYNVCLNIGRKFFLGFIIIHAEKKAVCKKYQRVLNKILFLKQLQQRKS